MNKYIYLLLITQLLSIHLLLAQGKRGYQRIMGYDASALDSVNEIMHWDFNEVPVDISLTTTTSGFYMEGSNTSMSDKEGNLLFYSNGCVIVNKEGGIMQNGDGLNPGFIGDFYCPIGGSPIRQGVVAIPAPGNEDVYYVFNLDFQTTFFGDTTQLGIAPERIYYQEIDMTQVQLPQLKCAGVSWTEIDQGGQAIFTPNLKKYIRFNHWNGLNIFDFDNETGDLSNPLHIISPNDNANYVGAAAVSSNSRFLYVCARLKVYQFDLEAADIAASKIDIAEWNGTYDPYATVFNLAALAPNGKIYISSTSSHLSLHVIEAPNNLGLDCRLIQNGVDLPSYNFSSIPNNPHYCRSEEECEITVNNVDVEVSEPVVVYPNPSKSNFNFILPQDAKSIEIKDVTGHIVLRKNIHQTRFQWSAEQMMNGICFYTIYSDKGMLYSGKMILIP